MKKIAILGDSYSAFPGSSPDDYAIWYNDTGIKECNDVHSVSEMWWYPVVKFFNLDLVTNCSYSGSTVCNIGFDGDDFSKISFNYRMKRELSPETDVDVILILGGTNDFWAASPVGEPKYSNWEDHELNCFCQAFCYTLDYLTKQHPNATILNILNDEIQGPIREYSKEICEHYNIDNLDLVDIDKEDGHPTKLGMRQIANQVSKWDSFVNSIK